jgi:adenine-specific DNA-methyltransferase
MQLNVQTPRKFLNPLLSQKSVVSTDVEAFKAALAKYVEDVQQLTDTRQSEPNIVAGALMPFLQAVPLGYNCRPHSQKGQSGIDLAILSGKDVTVIIEAKAVGSKDMITAHDLNKKAFHEAIFYFMQERSRKNDKLAHIVITDFQEWYVFDAKDFERLFWGNSQLNKTFHAYHNPNLLTTSTAEVYAAIAEELPRILKDLFTEEAIDCAYFSLAAPNIGKGGIKDKELTAIYKLLGPDSLLKGFNPNDANSLNREFYNELLYILGLNEVKDGGKRLIQASGIAGSLYDGIADKLDQKGAPHAFEDVIKLIIIWINRILFLKLLESQIVTWTGEKTSRFLSADKISGYDALENLFFDTLARRIPDRKNKGFDYIPYLNSSLFEMQEEEKTGISISALPDGAQIAYYSKTVVKDATTKRKSGQTSTLAYLFEFLDAYDFANDNDDEVREETKSLISASVLGLIFEKINGYKDGSFYTPSFVTMYMARQTIEKAVLQKFNEAYSWTCTALTGDGGLKNELKDHKIKKTDSNALIDSLKICDPAVGSGHFLVSALNEILYIKSLLGLLVDEAGDVLDYDIVIENDELIVTSDKGELFEYKKGSKEKTLVQKTLFQEKQKIIENCLFGVDINPNSVNICRLRLWIELLKNAYYQPNGELETLPNIDINIKCGNSLISRFALDADLKGALKKSKITVDEYRTAVSNYRNTSDKAEKRQIEALIERIKSNFRTEIQYYDPKQKRLEDLPKLIKALEITQSVLGETEKEEKERKQKQAKLQTELAKLSMEVNDIKNNIIYKNAFEWRFEFPEVMDAEGKFVGFDVIIGNPPYFSVSKLKEYGAYFEKEYQVYSKGTDVYALFYERGNQILRSNGFLTYITSNSWLRAIYGDLLKTYFQQSMQPLNLLNIEDTQIFDEATVESNIISLQKKKGVANFAVCALGSEYRTDISLEDYFLQNYFKVDPTGNEWTVSNSTDNALKAKITQNTKPLGTFNIAINFGIKTSYNAAFILDENTKNKLILDDANNANIIKPILRGRDLKKYSFEFSNVYLINTHNGLKSKEISRIDAEKDYPKIYAYLNSFQPQVTKRLDQGKHWSNLRNCAYLDDFNKPKIVWGEISDKPKFAYDDSNYFAEATTFLMTGEKLKFLLAILNSKVSEWYFNQISTTTGMGTNRWKKYKIELLPIANASKAQENELTVKVNAILKAKAKSKDTAKLEREIDDMVYRLYGLTYDEVKTIEPEYSLSREEYEATA